MRWAVTADLNKQAVRMSVAGSTILMAWLIFTFCKNYVYMCIRFDLKLRIICEVCIAVPLLGLHILEIRGFQEIWLTDCLVVRDIGAYDVTSVGQF